MAGKQILCWVEKLLHRKSTIVFHIFVSNLQTSDEEINTSIDAALRAGYRHIDTAYSYKNESAIGKVLKKWFDSKEITRDDLFIVTKVRIIEFIIYSLSY